MGPDAPAGHREVGGWKQTALHPAGQVEVTFEIPLLGRREVIQAETQQGVDVKPVLLDGVVADLAFPVTTLTDAGDGGVDLVEQPRDLGRGTELGRDSKELLSPAFELGQDMG